MWVCFSNNFNVKKILVESAHPLTYGNFCSRILVTNLMVSFNDDCKGNISLTSLMISDTTRYMIGYMSNDEELSLEILETLQRLSVQTIILNILKKIGKLKYLHSLFLFYIAYNQSSEKPTLIIYMCSKLENDT
ncbi:hypothetical protein IEQ34_014443 [Dendrobium chrysotoxum]|uniref:Uncharacterized protein n=1 Tax=Dendrobium chrysotoxum TaxID=161865 RepID=A0AAV7GJA7_DENCH|nr:hypothetical protein IEQ34_014443 [Dendrobium chrysotoxum]